MNKDYQASHNACYVSLDGHHAVVIRLFVYKGGQTPEWFFVAKSPANRAVFKSATFTSSTLAIAGILDFINVVSGLFFVGKYMRPSERLSELFADVIYK